MTDFFHQYDSLLVMDTETTGLDPRTNRIIQFCGLRVNPEGEAAGVYHRWIALPEGDFLPEFIVKLTGITDDKLAAQGISEEAFARDFRELIEGNVLLVSYNAHFDISFLRHMLLRSGGDEALRGKDMLDLLTVFRDRRPGPHKLSDAIAAYSLVGDACTHDAQDDAAAAYHLLLQMQTERDDLADYRNILGYSAKYGMPKAPIPWAAYRQQLPKV